MPDIRLFLSGATLNILVFVLSIQTSFFDVVDGHQDLSVFGDLVSLLFGDGGCFFSELSLSSNDVFMIRFEVGDVIVQLQDFLSLIFLVFLDSVFQFLKRRFLSIVKMGELGVLSDQGLMTCQDVSYF